MRVRMKRAADAGLGASVAAPVLAVLCLGGAAPGLADRYGSRAQDLLLRWTPGEDASGWVLNAAFALALAFWAVLALWAWRRGSTFGFVVHAVWFTVFGAGWAFGLEFLEAWVLWDPAPWWAR